MGKVERFDHRANETYSGWNRFAHSIVGSKLAGDVRASARFYAQLNYALANAAIGAWDSK
jgi:hypothetical protein